jgi:hypothetical protein
MAENRHTDGEARTSLDASNNEPPEGYEQTCQEMLQRAKQWLVEHPDRPPHFVAQPKGIAIVAALDQAGDRFCRNDAARELVADFIAIGIRIGGPRGSPTVLMMQVVMELAGVEPQRVSLSELGLSGAGVS